MGLEETCDAHTEGEVGAIQALIEVDSQQGEDAVDGEADLVVEPVLVSRAIREL